MPSLPPKESPWEKEPLWEKESLWEKAFPWEGIFLVFLIHLSKDIKFIFIMAKRLKITPFTRLFLFLIILAPIAYIGAALLKGDDGIDSLKNLFKSEEKTSIAVEQPRQDEASTYELQRLKSDLEDKTQHIEELLKENEDLKKENEDLKMQLQGNKREVN